MSQESIIDASKPNAGRMYDYYLGGSHNFEVDRQAAEQVLALLPYVSKYSRLQRWALQDIAAELTEKRGYEIVIDFASGLPTNDHIHYQVPPGSTVIYSDYDPVTVQYAREILGDTPNVYVFEGDARRPEELLNNPEVQQILGNRRKVAFVFWGVCSFLADEELAHTMRFLYDWAGPGSCLAFNAQTYNRNNPTVKQGLEIYKKMGASIFPRFLEEFQELIQPWQLEEPGWIPLLEWHGFAQSELAQENVEAFGPMGSGHGAYLVK